MRNSMSAAIAIAACASGCGAGGAATPDANLGDATPRLVISATKTLGLGELDEGMLVGGPGDFAAIHLVAPSADLDWNLHGHQDGGTQTIQEAFSVGAADYTFEPRSAGSWYLLVRNHGDAPLTIQVELDLFGDMYWSDWQ
jgi:hypothetical protein